MGAPAVADRPTDPPSRNVTALLVTTGLMYTGWDLVTPFVPLFVLDLEGGDPRTAAAWSGVAVGISPLLSALAGPIWGAFAERFGGRTALLRTIVTSAVLVTLTAFAMSIWHLVVLRALVGLLGGFYVLIHHLAAQATTRDRVGQTIGSLQAMQMTCLALVPPFAGLLIDRAGLRSSFLLAAGIMLVAFAVLWRFYRSTPRQPVRVDEPGVKGREGATPGGRKVRTPYWRLLARGELAIVALVVFSAQYVDRVFNALVPLLVVELVPGSEQIGFLTGLILGLGAGATALAALAAGRLARRVSPHRLLVGSLAAGVVLLPLLAMAGSVWQLLALRVALGVLAGGSMTLAYAFVSTLVPANRLGASFSMFASCALLGAAIGPLSLGPVAAFSLRMPLILGAVAFATCMLLLLKLGNPNPEITRLSSEPDPAGAS